MEIYIEALICYAVFFSLFVLLLFIAQKDKRLSQIPFLGLFILLTLFSGLRYGLGRDFEIYEFMYNNPVHSSSFDFVEPFWQTFIMICRTLGVPFLSWQLLVSGLTIGLCMYSFRRLCGSYWWMALLSFVLIYSGYFESFNIVRQYLSMSIVLASYCLLLDKKYGYWFLCCLLSFALHHSAVVFVVIAPFVLFTSERLGTKSWFLFLIVSFLVGKFFLMPIVDILTQFLPERYSLYTHSDKVYAMSSDSGVYPIFLNLTALFFLYLRQHIQTSNVLYRQSVDYYLTAIVFYNLFINFEIAARLFYYPFMFTFILFPLSFKYSRTKWVSWALSAILCVFSVFMVKNLGNIEEPYSKYRTIFDTIIYK